jgi:hypothetical protein
VLSSDRDHLEEVLVLSARLVKVIEEHAEELTRGVLTDVAANARTPHYHDLPADELHRRVYDVYHDLGRWLSDKTEGQVETTFGGLGRTRYREGVPLSEVVYALILGKDHLREYIRAVGLVDSAVELYLEEELHLMIGHFYDKAIYHTVKGYEAEEHSRAATSRPRTA